MAARKVMMAATASVIVAAGCGPMPGYVPEEDRGRVETSRSEPAAPPAAPVRRAPTGGSEVTVEPRADEREPAASPRNDDVRIVRLRGEDTYYLLDRARGLCFLHHRGELSEVECSRIPEARRFMGLPDPELVSPTAPAETDDVTETETGEGEPDEPTEQPEPEPPAPPAPVAPAPAPPPEVAPAPAPTPPAPAGDVRPPTPDELGRFETAFFQIFCDRQAGGETPPRTRIEAQGLTTQRFAQIESWWSSDQQGWWSLTQKARRSCDG